PQPLKLITDFLSVGRLHCLDKSSTRQRKASTQFTCAHCQRSNHRGTFRQGTFRPGEPPILHRFFLSSTSARRKFHVVLVEESFDEGRLVEGARIIALRRATGKGRHANFSAKPPRCVALHCPDHRPHETSRH